MNSSGAFFEDFADRFDSLYDGQRSRLMRWIDHRFRRDMFVRFSMTFDLLGDLNEKRILEIGCGSGVYIAEALKRGACHVTGIDPAPRMLALADRRVSQLGMGERVRFLEGYFPQMSPMDCFDFAIVMGVMDYVEDASALVRGLRSVVTRGAVLSFPSIHWFRTPLRKIRYRVRSCPVYFYTPVQIEGLARDAGLKHYSLTKIPGAGMDYVLWIAM